MSNEGNNNSRLTYERLESKFPFGTIRKGQQRVMHQIFDAVNEGYRHIILELPTGFGKSAVAIALAKALGTSYICSGTKDLQAQYVNDFKFIKKVIGMRNFTCLAKEDFKLNGSFECKECNKTKDFGKCWHTKVEHGLCRSEGNEGFPHVYRGCEKCRVGGCTCPGKS